MTRTRWGRYRQAVAVSAALALAACDPPVSTPGVKESVPPAVSTAEQAARDRGSPPLPPKTALSPRDRADWHALLKWPQSCEDAFAATMEAKTAGLDFAALVRDVYLVQITCTRGAYQGYQVYQLLDERVTPAEVRLLRFPVYESPEPGKLERNDSEEVWGHATFAPEAHRLVVLNRFRGVGDCGTLAAYEISERGPVLAVLRAKLVCDGHWVDPESWPVVNKGD